MSHPYKICPICNSPNHRNASICSTCGATLTQIKLITPEDNPPSPKLPYEQLHGETDLYEANLQWRGGTYLVAAISVLATLICVSSIVILGGQFINEGGAYSQNLTPGLGTTTLNANTQNNLPIQTNTARPTVFLVTVTQGSPTQAPTQSPTITPTQGPCTQIVQSGDDLIAIIFRCGHRQFDTIIDTVVELNELEDSSRIQEGQTIQVPWPTATVDPNDIPTETVPADQSDTALDSSLTVGEANSESVMGVQLVPTETLQPGVSWHTVRKDENVIIIAVAYGATLRILSELNPEVTFSQCDFGLGTGGENCVVQLFEGQQLRVPAPTPTPTIQPTASGSETATPTATPTFNAPTALSPSNRAFFEKDDLITLRWVGTGALDENQSYLIQIEDQTSGSEYSATTRDLFFIVPSDWQGEETNRHDYEWTVSVIDSANPENPYFTTETRMFTWQGQGST